MMTANPVRSWCSKSRYIRRLWRSALSNLLAGLTLVFVSGASVSSAPDALPPSYCWVEFRFSPPLKVMVQTGKSISSFKNFDRYAVVTDPSVPDYRVGIVAGQHLFYLFLESCENSRKAIAALVGNSLERELTPKVSSMTVRPSTPKDLQRREYLTAKPKYWIRDCIVGVDIIRPPRENVPRDKSLLRFLARYNIAYGPTFQSAVGELREDYNNTRYYIQYWHSCDRRIEMANRFLAAYKRFYDDGGRYEVLDEKFEANVGGGMVIGPMWLDHYFPDGPPKNSD